MGKVSAALKLLRSNQGGVLSLESQIPNGQNCDGTPIFKTVKEGLSDKHPVGQPAVNQAHLDSSYVSPPIYDPVLFEQLTGSVIKWAALHTQGAAGPSGIDAYG